MGKFGKIGFKRINSADDLSDKLNYQFSTMLIIVLISAVLVKQYFGKSIQCWAPQEFTKNWEEYSENYCGISDTNFGPAAQKLPGIDMGPNNTKSAHKYATIVLAFQALCFCIPYMIWRLLILHSPFNLHRIMQTAKDANAICSDHLQKSIKFIAIHMDNCMNSKNVDETQVKATPRTNRGCCTLSSGYLSAVYIIIKLLYFINIVVQFFLIKKFIGTDYSSYGMGVVYDLLSDTNLRPSYHLPKFTWCNMEMKKIGRVHFYTLQCVLPLNMFLEKIFILLWFWNVIIGCITAISLLRWLNKFLNKKDKSRFIREYLKLMESAKKSEDSWKKEFIFDYLQTDGIFVMHLISINMGDIVAADVVCELWNLYSKKHENESETLKSYEETKFCESKFKNVNKESLAEFPGKSNTNEIF